MFDSPIVVSRDAGCVVGASFGVRLSLRCPSL